MQENDNRLGQDRSLMVYPCGVRAGDRLRLKQDLHTPDVRDRRTGEAFRAGSVWTVVPGVESVPEVVWLHQPDQFPHTWDGSVLETFELIASPPPVGSLAALSRLPEWVAGMPSESRLLFTLCVGRPLPVEEVDLNGLVVLDARVFDPEVGGSYNDIRVEAEILKWRDPTHAA